MQKDKSIDKLIEDSGIITHHKVISSLKKNGWSVLISPYYYDNISNAVREIDIVAEKQFNSSSLPNDSSVQINVQLFLECKYIKQEIIFWFDNKDIDSAVSMLEKNTGLKILHNRLSADISTKKFHYLDNDRVAKLFSTNTNREDVIYKAITQCLNAKIYYDQWFNHPISFEFAKHGRSNTKIIKFPIIICDNFNKFLDVNFDDNIYKYEKIKGHFQLEINYTYLDKERKSAITDYFIIDIIDYNDIDNFLGKINQEISSIVDSTDQLSW